VWGKGCEVGPPSDESYCFEFLAKRGSRSAGTPPMFLRCLGWDGCVTSIDVVACLRGRLDKRRDGHLKRDLAKVCRRITAWRRDRPAHTQLSRICGDVPIAKLQHHTLARLLGED